MPNEASQEWFEAAWTFREETVYASLFGSTGPGIYALDADLFAKQFRQESIDPRWLTYGVFECPPTSSHDSWVYVSSGLSNAWEAESPEPDGLSGLGEELLIECVQQSRWALLLLRSMVAFQILLSVGRYSGKATLTFGDRIPVRQPIDGAKSALSWVVVAPSKRFGGFHQLPSGRFQFLQFLGITEDEAQYAKLHGSDKLIELLDARDVGSVVDPSRRSALPVN
jgi:hypothetical protein